MIRIAHYKGKGNLFNKIIRAFQRLRSPKAYAKYSHTEIVIGNRWYGASNRENRVRVRKITGNSGNWDFTEIPMSKRDMAILEIFLKSQVGEGYDRLGIVFSQIVPLQIDDPKKWFCSELVAEALMIMSVLPRTHHASWYSPARLKRALENMERITNEY